MLALLAGSLIPLNGALNARLGAAIVSPIYASMISFLIGTMAIGAYALTTRQTVSWGGMANTPWYGWLCGAFSLTAIILTYPKLGPGIAFGLVVAGQLAASMVLEHFNILVAEPHPISFLRVAGLGLVLGGVYMIRAF